jgi:hypothetical protein
LSVVEDLDAAFAVVDAISESDEHVLPQRHFNR